MHVVESPEALASRYVAKHGGEDSRTFMEMLGLDQPKQSVSQFNRGPQVSQGDPIRRSTTPKHLVYV